MAELFLLTGEGTKADLCCMASQNQTLRAGGAHQSWPIAHVGEGKLRFKTSSALRRLDPLGVNPEENSETGVAKAILSGLISASYWQLLRRLWSQTYWPSSFRWTCQYCGEGAAVWLTSILHINFAQAYALERTLRLRLTGSYRPSIQSLQKRGHEEYIAEV